MTSQSKIQNPKSSGAFHRVPIQLLALGYLPLAIGFWLSTINYQPTDAPFLHHFPEFSNP